MCHLSHRFCSRTGGGRGLRGAENPGSPIHKVGSCFLLNAAVHEMQSRPGTATRWWCHHKHIQILNSVDICSCLNC